jgi:hypothetical protein
MSRIVKRVMFPERCNAVSVEMKRGASPRTITSVKVTLETALLRIVLHWMGGVFTSSVMENILAYSSRSGLHGDCTDK